MALPLKELNVTSIIGWVSARNVPNFERGSGFLFRKGTILEADKLETKILSLSLYAPADYALHLIQIEESEVSEDTAGLELARMVAGFNLELQGPIESRVNLVATQRGLLKIDVKRLEKLNQIEGMAVFTLYDNMAVEAGTIVAGAKVTPLVYSKAFLKEAQEIIKSQPLIEILEFQPLKIGVIIREQLKPKPRARFVQAVEQKLAWFGAQLLGIETAYSTTEALLSSLQKFKAKKAELILHVGGHSNDPLDPMFPALQALDVKMERHGAPAHPGTLFWLAYWEDTALFGLASCGMFSKTTLGDLFLARYLAGERLSSQAIAQMGYGGLFTREMAFRFPPYELNNTIE